jgi:hypothetical protein
MNGDEVKMPPQFGSFRQAQVRSLRPQTGVQAGGDFPSEATGPEDYE